MDMERRELLNWLGVGGGIGVGAVVCFSVFSGVSPDETATPWEPNPGPPREPPVRHEEAFGTVIKFVAAGVDPDGDTVMNPFIEPYADDDTLLSFPTIETPDRSEGIDEMDTANGECTPRGQQ